MKRINQGEVESKKCYVEKKMSGGVYVADKQHWDFVNDVMNKFVVTNPLHADEFTIVTQMEAEILRMVLNLYHGDEKSCGILTSGGTESIIMAVLAYREEAKARGVIKPNMVVSQTAHAAFEKAAFYFQIEYRKVPITKDYRADVKAMGRQIDSNTIMLVCSSPEYPYGNFDPAP